MKHASVVIKTLFDKIEPVYLECKDPSLAVQSALEEVDINNIVKRYQQTGVATHINQSPAFYADLSEPVTLTEAFEKIEIAKDLFMKLPVHVREYFNHDPQSFVAFTSDPQNEAEMIKLGLVVKPDNAPQQELKETPSVPEGTKA